MSPFWCSEGDRRDRHSVILGQARGGEDTVMRIVGIGRPVLPAVGQQHDAGRRRGVPTGHGGGFDRMQGGEDGLTGRGAVAELEVLQRLEGRLVLRGRGNQQVRRARETDQAEIDARRQLLGELAGRLLGGLESGGLDIGGPHGIRHVDHQHDDGAVARYAHVMGGGGQRHGQQDQGEQRHRDRKVPPQRLRHLGLGEPVQASSAPSLDDDVDGEQRQRHQTEQQHARALEPIQR